MKNKFLISTVNLSASIFFLCGFLMLLVSLPTSAKANQDEPYYISLQSAILFALHESSKIKVAQEKENQALYSVDEASAVLYPDVRVLAELGREYNSPAAFDNPVSPGENSHSNNSSDITLTLRQMLFDRTKTGEIKRQEQLHGSKGIEKNIVIEDVLEKTVEAYIGVLIAQKNAYAAADMLVTMRGLVEKVAGAFQAGGQSKAKYDFSLARLSLAESKYNSALSVYEDSVSELEALIGRMPKFLAIEPEELTVHDYDLEVYKHLAAKKNNELQLINSNIDASRIDYENQKSTYLPKVNFVVEAGRSFDRGGDVGSVMDASAMVQVQYDIFKGFSRRALKNKAASRIKEMEYEKQDLIKEITKKVKLSYNEIMATYKLIHLKNDEVESYLSLRKITLDSLSAGEVDLFQSIENEENIYDALSEIYTGQSNVYTESYGLLKLIGSLQKNKFCESC